MPEYPFGVDELNKELEEEFDFNPEDTLDEEDFEELKEASLERSFFPITTLICAILKDFTDIFSLGILGTFINIIAWAVIRLYVIKRPNYIKRRLNRRYIGTIITEFIPLVNIFPSWTYFVWRAYSMEHKRLDQIFTAMEKIALTKAQAPPILTKIAERNL